jgi:NAD(P)-dependent dehydrogenase (short-subunit alcohol dehydrogenase family)
MAVQYNTGKAALIRAVGCLQEELNLDNENNIHIYALHPGGVLSGLQSILAHDLAKISSVSP